MKFPRASGFFRDPPQPAFIKWSKFDTHGYDSEVSVFGTHTGTHMDAPCHFTLNGKSINQIDVNRFVCKDALLLKIEKETNEADYTPRYHGLRG